MEGNTTIKTYNFEHFYLSDVERNFDNEAFNKWMENNWQMSFPIVTAYVIIIFSLKKLMEKRPAFKLTVPLFLWNLFLSVFNIWGAIKSAPELLYVLQEFGFQYSICDATAITVDKPVALWCMLYVASKAVELIDTIFIVLRKKPLLFLHWYHHVTVLLAVWYCAGRRIGIARWFGIVNTMVHAIMYTYYTLKTMKIRVPKPIAMSITASQIVQMMVGVYVNYSVFFVLQRNESCTIKMQDIFFFIFMYFSYLVLFGKYFWNAYIEPVIKYSTRKKVE